MVLKDTKTMQEVNVQVAVRTRPLLTKERLAGDSVCVRVVPTSNQVILGKDRVFTFDHVFPSKSTQQEIYEKCVDPLVRSCFEGYNATVFAYGQTGSGKTYTIGGNSILDQGNEDLGIIPKAIHQIFETVQNVKGFKCTIKISYIEIYKDELCDLLEIDVNKDMYIREDNTGNTMVVGAAEIECEAVEDVMVYLEQGSGYRHTGSTQMNEHSSRSHTVFTVIIEQRLIDEKRSLNRSNNVDDIFYNEADMSNISYTCAKFHFVDLAGSERAHRTGNVGERFKESIHINTGLLALGNVISALGDVKKKSTHIPYRDAKITRLLKDSLGGNAKTLMICCISPSSANFDESLNALKYANRARNIKNKPIVNHDPHSIQVEEMKSEIKTLREELYREKTKMNLLSAAIKNGDVQPDTEGARRVEDLEQQLNRLKMECMQYRAVSEEAYRQLIRIKDKSILSQSLSVPVCDWIELMDQLKSNTRLSVNDETFKNQRINQLEMELDECKNDLKNDEEIFAEKAREMVNIQERMTALDEDNSELVQKIEELEKVVRQQQEQILAKQMENEELTNKMKNLETHRSLEISLAASTVPNPPTRIRAVSVPAHAMNERLQAKQADTRNVHTSPAMFTMDRIIRNFRARSQLLLAHLEDNDEVLTHRFADDDGFCEEKENKFDILNKNETEFDRNDKSRKTYLVKNNVGHHDQDFDVSDFGNMPISKVSLNACQPIAAFVQASSDNNNRRKLKRTEMSVRHSTVMLKDLTMNIKLKEQLIRQLVKTEQESQHMNSAYQEKISILEAEKMAAIKELGQLQRELESKEKQDKATNEKLQIEFRKKMEAAKSRIKVLKIKQIDTKSMADMTTNSKRIQDLEASVENMRKQQIELQRQLKQEMDAKVKLERELHKELQNPKKSQKRDTKELLTAKLAEMSDAEKRQLNTSYSLKQSQSNDQQMWLEQQMEVLLHQRKIAEDLQKELDWREKIVSEREELLAQARHLEMKGLRASQAVSQDVLRASIHLESLEKKVADKSKELASVPKERQAQISKELEGLQSERDLVFQQCSKLNSKVKGGKLLDESEHRKLMELEEVVEALDAAIEYKNELIANKQLELRQNVQRSQNGLGVLSRLKSMSADESRSLLTRYFQKVVDLRDEQRKMHQHCSQLEATIDDHVSKIQELEMTLSRSNMELERRLTAQQQDYEQKIEVVLRNMTESEISLKPKVAELEKELFYYKTNCRDLKKKLRDLLTNVKPVVDSTKVSCAERIKLSAGDTPSVQFIDTPRDIASRSNQKSSLVEGSQNHAQSNAGFSKDTKSVKSVIYNDSENLEYVPTPRSKSSVAGASVASAHHSEQSQPVDATGDVRLQDVPKTRSRDGNSKLSSDGKLQREGTTVGNHSRETFKQVDQSTGQSAVRLDARTPISVPIERHAVDSSTHDIHVKKSTQKSSRQDSRRKRIDGDNGNKKNTPTLFDSLEGNS